MLSPIAGLFLLSAPNPVYSAQGTTHVNPSLKPVRNAQGAATKPQSTQDKAAQDRIAQDKTFEVPFIIGDHAIIVPAKVNGRKLSLMFDTGFGGHVVCDDSTNLGKVTGTMGLKDFVGQFEVETVKINSLKLGEKSIPVTDAEAVMQPGAENTFGYNVHTDGIMGFSVIKDTITEINFQNSKFIFHPSTLDISKRVPDNKTTFLAKLLPIGQSSLEMQVKTSDGKALTLALDTGNGFYATTHKDVLERVGLWKPGRKPEFMKQSFVASGPVDSFYVKMPPVEIFGVPVESSIWDIIDLPSSTAEGDGTVGFGFLSNFNIIIDYQRRRVWLENFTKKVADDELYDAGLSAYYFRDRKKTLVVNVTPNGPAAKAGIKRGDELLGVDNEETTGMAPRRIEKLMTGAKDSKVKLALSRGGALYRVEITRESLINDLTAKK